MSKTEHKNVCCWVPLSLIFLRRNSACKLIKVLHRRRSLIIYLLLCILNINTKRTYNILCLIIAYVYTYSGSRFAGTFFAILVPAMLVVVLAYYLIQCYGCSICNKCKRIRHRRPVRARGNHSGAEAPLRDKNSGKFCNNWSCRSLILIIGFYCSSHLIIVYQCLSLPFTAYCCRHCFSLLITSFHWLLLPFVGHYWLPSPITSYHCLSLLISSHLIIVYHCLSLLIISYHCASLGIIDYRAHHSLSHLIIVYHCLLLLIRSYHC